MSGPPNKNQYIPPKAKQNVLPSRVKFSQKNKLKKNQINLFGTKKELYLNNVKQWCLTL